MYEKDELAKKKLYLNLYASLTHSVKILSNIIDSLQSDSAQKHFSSQTASELNHIIEHLNSLATDKYLLCAHIVQLINTLQNETEKNILLLKYVEDYTWEEISEQLNYSPRQIYNLHHKALSHLKFNGSPD